MFVCYYCNCSLNLKVKVSTAEVENKILKDSGVDTRSIMTKLEKTYLTKTKI